MSTATEYRPQSLTGRLPGKRAYRRSAVNTGFRGTFGRDNYRSRCIKDSVLLDPTCGSGGFLIKVFEYVREKIENEVKREKRKLRSYIEGDDYESLSEKERLTVNKQIERMQLILNKELDTQQEGSRMYELSHKCIYGTDANPRMARTSKMNMIMHGDGHGGVHHHDGLLNVNGIFEERFDVILTNPPFGSRIDKKQKISEEDRFKDKELIEQYQSEYGRAYDEALRQVDENVGKSLVSLFDVGSMSGLTEVLFMERCIRLLKKGGRMGMVLPEGVLNTASLQKVREYFEGRAKIILICSIPQDVFIAAGATVKPSLVFFKRFTEEEEREYEECVSRARCEIREKYNDEIVGLQGEMKLLSENIVDEKAEIRKKKKTIQKCLREIEIRITEEAKPLVKDYFDYEIPIAKVEDAGITTTGALSKGNQLPQLLDEYKNYRVKNKLWETFEVSTSYKIKADGRIVKVLGDKEVDLAWQI